MFKRIPGTKDILPEEVSRWQQIERIAHRIFTIYNYQEIRFPILEEASLFNRSLGNYSEVVQKQMFLTRSGKDIYALRPEGTASVARAYIENNLDKIKGLLKVYYIGPMFRLERPQKGRLRQFHHIGCEVIGSQDSSLDAEIISLADALLNSFSINDYQIHLNSLGCKKDKHLLAQIIQNGLKDKLDRLCADCKRRFKVNILRILDCKNKDCQETIKQLEIQDKHLCLGCKTDFEELKENLRLLKIDYQINPYLVRGLDYYTGMVFEITHKRLGSQDALGAGGRYDNLIEELGGHSTPAVGFAFGVERLLLVSNFIPYNLESKKLIYIITLDKEAKKLGLELMNNLRKKGFCVDTDYEGKTLKGAMRKANDLKASFVIIIGEDELKKGVFTLRDMLSGGQKQLNKEQLIQELNLGIGLKQQSAKNATYSYLR
ncbi:MAG: histidine--tRNA ligase [Candidatus Omnitrophica bacterium]|nr:histidine--tRNA ligase [Candidatus Omnitrophota bacterium]